MEPFRLHLKIGPHEFDAQGEQEAVERQFAVWRELISQFPSPPPIGSPPASVPLASEGAGAGLPGDFADYGKVFRQEGRLVSLSVLPRGDHAEADGALLILLGRKHYLDEDLVGGSWIMDGLTQSGMRVARVDRMFGDYMERFVTRVGQNRAVRYRLTNLGLAHATEIAGQLVGLVA